MGQNITGKIKLPPKLQVGMVVRDVEQVKRLYSSAFGIGPWLVHEHDAETKAYDGKRYKYKVKAAFADLGPAQLELFQLTEGRSPVHSDWLDKGYEGVHHLSFFVDAGQRRQFPLALAEMGWEVYQEREQNVFVNTAKTGGVFFEFVSAPMPEPPPRPPGTGKIKLPPRVQLGIVVKGVDKVAAFYESAFGIGPWEKRLGHELNARSRGREWAFKTQVAFADFAGVQFELFTITEGCSPVHSLFLDKGREGIHHLGFFVTEEERHEAKKRLAELGIGIFQEGEVPGRGKYVFFDMVEQGGLLFEFVARIAG
jgi:hypothetical protein